MWQAQILAVYVQVWRARKQLLFFWLDLRVDKVFFMKLFGTSVSKDELGFPTQLQSSAKMLSAGLLIIKPWDIVYESQNYWNRTQIVALTSDLWGAGYTAAIIHG